MAQTAGILKFRSADGRVQGRMLLRSEDLAGLVEAAGRRATVPGTWELYHLRFGRTREPISRGPFASGKLVVGDPQ